MIENRPFGINTAWNPNGFGQLKGSVITVASMLVLLAAGIGIGWGFQSTIAPASSGTVAVTGQIQGEYPLTLVITTQNTYNSTTGTQPAYYVLTSEGLQSSANIALPANTMIKLTIVCYDVGSAPLITNQYANVQGTVNGTVTYTNNDDVNSSEGPNGMVLKGGETVTKVSPDLIAHTFTIPTLKVNIPVPANSTVVAYFKTGAAGTYAWYCETACGAGSSGILGAMDTPGWMTGKVTIS
jgi:heme/copper-type cytochrome/quinol oxidase subunit 2